MANVKSKHYLEKAADLMSFLKHKIWHYVNKFPNKRIDFGNDVAYDVFVLVNDDDKRIDVLKSIWFDEYMEVHISTEEYSDLLLECDVYFESVIPIIYAIEDLLEKDE